MHADPFSQRFTVALARLQGSDELAWAAPPGSPVVGVGHSNGALLHLLIGALCAPGNAANALISFNNKQVRDAVPVPLDGIRPTIKALRDDAAFIGATASVDEVRA